MWSVYLVTRLATPLATPPSLKSPLKTTSLYCYIASRSQWTLQSGHAHSSCGTAEHGGVAYIGHIGSGTSQLVTLGSVHTFPHLIWPIAGATCGEVSSTKCGVCYTKHHHWHVSFMKDLTEVLLQLPAVDPVIFRVNGKRTEFTEMGV